MTKDDHLIYESFLVPRLKKGDDVFIKEIAGFEISGKKGKFVRYLIDNSYKRNNTQYEVFIDEKLHLVWKADIDWEKTEELRAINKKFKSEDKETASNLLNV